MRLLHGHEQVAQDEPRPDPVEDLRRQHRGLADEERVDPASARRHLPQEQERPQEDGAPEADPNPRDLSGPLVANTHLVLEVLPDRLVQAAEVGMEADLGDRARSRQGDRVDGLDAPGRGAHHHDAIRQRDGLFQVVGHEHHRAPQLGPDLEQVVLHEIARLHVERAERLVHQDDLGVVDHRHGQRHPLAHAARQLMRMIALEAGEADPRDPLGHPRARRVGVDPTKQERQTDVLGHGLPGKDGVALEDEAEPRIHTLDGLPVQADPALGDGSEPGHETEQRRLSAARRAHDRHELAAPDVEGDVLDGGELPAFTRQRKPLGHPLQRDAAPAIVAGHSAFNSSSLSAAERHHLRPTLRAARLRRREVLQPPPRRRACPCRSSSTSWQPSSS